MLRPREIDWNGRSALFRGRKCFSGCEFRQPNLDGETGIDNTVSEHIVLLSSSTISLRHFVEEKKIKKMKDRLESLAVLRRKFITTPRCNRPASRCFFEETGDA